MTTKTKIQKGAMFVFLPCLVFSFSGCGILSNDRAEYYQAMQAREERIASRQAAAELRLQAAQQTHDEQMSRIITQAGGIADPHIRGIVLVSVTGSMGMAHIATTALALGKTEDKAQPIAPPESTKDTLMGVASVLAPIVPWIGHYATISRLAHSGLGTNQITAQGDIAISGSWNDQQAFSTGDNSSPSNTVTPAVEVVQPEVIMVEPFVVP